MDDTSVTVLICTRNRAESLALTMRDLAKSMESWPAARVVLVDNGSSDNTSAVAAEFASLLPIQVLREDRPGKAVALNRALRDAALGEIIAILDDDISVHPKWLLGVVGTCSRWPDHDVFCGRLQVRWPSVDKPQWAGESRIQWVFSALDYGSRDQPIFTAAIPFPPGGCFWFRRRVLKTGVRFRDVWLTEPAFTLELADAGFKGMAGGDAVAYHRIQEWYFEKSGLRSRVIRQGRELADVQIRFGRHSRRYSRARTHRTVFFILSLARLLRWMLCYAKTWLLQSEDERFARQILALLGISHSWEAMRLSRHHLSDVAGASGDPPGSSGSRRRGSTA